MKLFRNEVEFWDAFKRLDALNGLGMYNWETPTARKKHTDEFGVEIEEGETHFKRKTGSSGFSYVTMSRASMEKLVYAVVYSSPPAEMNCEKLRKELGFPLPSEMRRDN